ncbi:glycosyltransferase family 4 protein [Metabacillus indicus]|uniref:glycosyltransferase family 4 protein n=1 Tax=Metabacillus indicus TaxID=246786 RepID=UPI002A04761E|nr:glycosyltransferase family 4 protein [Metabacillus indicus]MDX8288966.1 glycosyltransferase family 4 protein [Metabacillus indicus]
MRIIYITQHFPPEIGAAQGRAFDMSTNLSNLGHDLHVLTAFPKPSSTLFSKEKVNKLSVYRSFQIRDTKKSSIRRLANYLSFMVSSVFSGFRVRKPDIVYATSPQLFQGVTGYILSRIHRTKFVFEVRDLWVDFAEILGQFKNKRLLDLARKLERFIYNRADLIVVVTHGYKDRLIGMGISADKIIVIPNGVNPPSLEVPAQARDVKKELGIENQFLVLYTGNIGAAQGLQTVIDAADKLKHDPSICFLFIGEGVEKEPLMEKATSMGLTNVRFLEGKRKEDLASYYESADLGIVSLKKHPLFEITIPSKVFDYMAVSLPVLIGVEGEAKEIVEANEAGFPFEPENADDFIRALKLAQSQPERLQMMKKGLRGHLLQSFNRETQAKELSDALQKLQK